MDTGQKAKELLTEIDKQIADLEKQLTNLKTDRREIAKVVTRLSGKPAARRRGRRPGRKPGRPAAKVRRAGRRRGRPRLKAVARKRTDWTRVIARFDGPFTLDDLAKASKKKKPTVNQAVQNLKKAGKIVPTGKRGEYRRVSA